MNQQNIADGDGSLMSRHFSTNMFEIEPLWAVAVIQYTIGPGEASDEFCFFHRLHGTYYVVLEVDIKCDTRPKGRPQCA